MKKISIITINYNTPQLTAKAVNTVIKGLPQNYWEAVVIDNGSDKKIKRESVNDPSVKIIYNKKNLGFAAAVNQGIKQATGKYLLLINSDLFINGKDVDRMVAYMDKNFKVAIIAPQLIYPNGKIQNSF